MVAAPLADALPKLTQIRISGLRIVEDVTLDLQGLTVLVGDNGTGKSSIIEALELLRQSFTEASFTQDVIDIKHGGLRSLLRRGSDVLRLGCRFRTGEDHVDYDVEIARQGDRAVVAKRVERRYTDGNFTTPVSVAAEPILETIEPPASAGISVGQAALMKLLGLSLERATPPRISNLTRAAIRDIDVHAPFETRPVWQQRELDVRSGPRVPHSAERASKLSRYGVNLVNAFLELRNRGGNTWDRVIERCRLGIRDDLRNFSTEPARRGELELMVHFGHEAEPLPAEYLSEGQLAYLCMVALCELSSASSLLAFDEPEVHLHPGLIARVMLMLEELAQEVPVLLSTHSDRLLDCLSAPEKSVVLCELDDHGATRLRRPDPEELSRWLKDYRGYGSIRAGGYEPYLFSDPSDNDTTR